MKKQLFFVASLSLLITFGAIAQVKGLQEKLKKVEGKTESVIIKTDKGSTTFSGDEAEALLKMLKAKTHGKKIIIVDGEDDVSCCGDDGENFDESNLPIKKMRLMHHGAPDENIEIELSDIMDSSAANKVRKKVVVDNRDGDKTVTITTTENGAEKVEMLEGADAEKFLKEHKEKEEKIDLPASGQKKKIKKIIIEDENKK